MASEYIGKLTAGMNREIKTVIVNVCTEEDSWIDMYLMSLCHHNIIANSTFSWWGARLNANPGKIVISPAFWARKGEKLYPGIMMKNIIRIDSQGNIFTGGKGS